MPRINQIQVNPKIDLTFARVLRTALRLDPDIILVGEMRDQETGEIALRAALTGHLVMSTLHTNDAVSTALRLIDMGMEPFLVASSVQAIIAQRLVRRVCEHCRTEHAPDANELAWLRSVIGSEQLPVFYAGSGCNYCNQTGYAGRTGVYELLVMNEALIDALRNNDQTAFEQAATEQPNYRPLVYHALELAEAGQTTVEETMRLSGWLE